jgi:hypothetical protein
VNDCAIEGLQQSHLVIPSLAMSTNDSLPDDVETLQRLLLTRDTELARARAEASSTRALIAHPRLTIEKLKRDLFGPRNERKARLLDQMELELEELEAAATEDELAAEKAAAASSDTTQVRAFTRKRPARQSFPAHLPRERIIVPGPTACACCGSTKLAKLRSTGSTSRSTGSPSATAAKASISACRRLPTRSAVAPRSCGRSTS